MRMLIPSIRKCILWALAVCFLAASHAHAILEEHVAAQGLIVPKDGLIQGAAPAGRTGQAIVQELKVKAGDVLQPGQVIASLQGRASAEVDIEAAGAQVSEAQAGIEIVESQLKAVDAQVAAAQADVAIAEQQVKAAEAAVAQAQAGVAQAQAGVAVAQKGRREALEKIDAALTKIGGLNSAYQNSLDEWDPPTREREEIKMQQKQLNEEYRATQSPRAATVARLDAEVAAAEGEVAAAEAAVAAAQADVAVAQSQVDAAKQGVSHAESQRTILQAELARAKAAVELAEVSVKQAQTALAMTEVTAPSAGTVLYVGARAGEAVGPMGVVTLGDVSELFVEAEIYIDDARKVKAGQKVTISSDAFEGELKGKVIEVGQLVNPQGVFSPDPLEFSDKRVVQARIQLDPAQGWRPPVHSQVIARIQVGGGK